MTAAAGARNGLVPASASTTAAGAAAAASTHEDTTSASAAGTVDQRALYRPRSLERMDFGGPGAPAEREFGASPVTSSPGNVDASSLQQSSTAADLAQSVHLVGGSVSGNLRRLGDPGRARQFRERDMMRDEFPPRP